MATRKSAKRSTRPKAAARKTAKKAARKPATPAARAIRPGFISHTELASADPAATKAWAIKAFGWKFGDAMPMPDGSLYHSWSFGESQGGGIRANQPPEAPGTVPYVEVKDIQAAYAKALKEGAAEMMPPMSIPGSGGWIAIVKAPGGPAIGLWGTK